MATTKAKELAHIKYVGKGRIEKNLQTRVVNMQLAIAKNTITLGSIAEKADKELEKIRKTRLALSELKQAPVSNYNALRLLYNGTLRGITVESLAKEYANKANTEKAKFIAVTKEQGEVIDKYYALKAAKDWGVISSVARVLSIDTPATVEEQVIAQPTAEAAMAE